MNKSEVLQAFLNNPQSMVVNRKEKMNRTIDKMCDNIEIKQKRFANSAAVQYDERHGYGQGRRNFD